MVLLLCLWDNLKFWSVFSVGNGRERDNGEPETVSSTGHGSSSSRRQSCFTGCCSGVMCVPSCMLTSASIGNSGGGGSSTAKVSCSYYEACNRNQTSVGGGSLNLNATTRRKDDDNRCTGSSDDDYDEDDGDGMQTKNVGNEVRVVVKFILPALLTYQTFHA